MNFTFSYMELIPLAPVMIVAVTAIMVMLLVSLKRNHQVIAIGSIFGLGLALILLVLDLLHATAPANIMGLFTVDAFAQVYMLLILISAIACCIFTYAYIDGYKDNREELYILLLASVTGALLMVSSTHYASFFISLETMSVPIYGMLAYTYQRSKSLEAGVKYLVLSATASAMLLMGFAYLYAYSGEMLFFNSAEKITRELHEPLVLMGVALVVFACAFKLSMAPFHKWTADVYQGAPAPVVIYLGTVAKAAMLGLVLRYLLTSGSLVFNGMMLLLTIIAVLSILFGNLLAVTQVNLKRILAFSSIAHFGYLLVALISTHVNSVSTISIYIIAYTITTIGAFGAISLMSSPYNNLSEAESTADFRGLFWHHPVLTVILTIMLLSLAGIPTTMGFIGKFTVIVAAVAEQQWFLAGLIVMGSGIGLYYYLRVMVVMYLTPPRVPRPEPEHTFAQVSATALLVLVAIVVIVFGCYPQPMFDLASAAMISVIR